MTATPVPLAERKPPQLDFAVESVAAVEHAVVPTLAFRVHVDAGGRTVRSLALNVQVRIDAPRRGYDPGERDRLHELFGPPSDWGRTVHTFLWTNVSATVPSFDGETTFELLVPCTYDFDVVASKYLRALAGGTVPLDLLFSGTIFFAAPDGRLQVAHVPWDREARVRMPVRVWRDALERAFPGTAWLRVGHDVFDRLQAYKAKHALLTWDRALEELLPDE